MSLWWHSPGSGEGSGAESAAYRKDFERFCPILSLISDLPKQEYFKAAHRIVRKITGENAPNPRTERKQFLKFLKQNKSSFRFQTKNQLLKQIKIVPYKYPIHTIFFELSQNIKNENLLLSTLPQLLRENKFFDKKDLAEQLFDHYFPFIKVYRPSDELTFSSIENQLNMFSILEYAVLHYPNFSDNIYCERLSKFFITMANIVVDFEGTIRANAWRVFYNTFIRIFPKFPANNTSFILNYVSTILMEKSPNQKMNIYLLKSLKSANFVIGNYYSTKIIDNPHLIQEDFDIIDRLTNEHANISYPLYIIRHLIQLFISGDAFSKTAFYLLSKNTEYITLNKRLHNWVKCFFKRSFQWLYVVKRVNKYKNRRIFLIHCLARLYQLNIPDMNQIILSSAASLLNSMPYPEVQQMFPDAINAPLDPTFDTDFSGLLFNIRRLKKHLLWPQEKLNHPKRFGTSQKGMSPRPINQERIRDTTSSTTDQFSSSDFSSDEYSDSYSSYDDDYQEDEGYKKSNVKINKGKITKKKPQKKNKSSRKYDDSSSSDYYDEDSYSSDYSDEEAELVYLRQKDDDYEYYYTSSSSSAFTSDFDLSSDELSEENKVDDNELNDLIFNPIEYERHPKSKKFTNFLLVLFIAICFYIFLYLYLYGKRFMKQDQTK